MPQDALRKLNDGYGSRFDGPRGGEAEAGPTNVVRAFAAPPVAASLVRAICAIRQERSNFIPGKLLGEPAWDLLLRLYAAELDQERMSITKLTRRSGIAATTVLRCIATLAQAGLVRRSDDPMDARRVCVALTLSGVEALNAFFAASGARAVFL